MAYQRQWLRPLKILESYVFSAPGVTSFKDAHHQLYWAVVEGSVRGRHEGKELDAATREKIRAIKQPSHPDDMWVLPPDIELSVEDAERIWRTRDIDPADDITIYGMSQANLINSAGTAVLNLSTLLERLETRQRAADGSAAAFQTEFEERWTTHFHEAKTFLAHVTDRETRAPMLNQLKKFEARRDELCANEPKTHETSPPSRRGRKRGSGSLKDKDFPFVEEMNALIESGKATSPHAAAMKVADRAPGGGTHQSKVRRLVDRYKDSEFHSI